MEEQTLSQQQPPHLEDFCLWELEAQEFTTGIVGSGPGFMTILDIISSERYRDFLPQMRLVAVAEATEPRKIRHVEEMGVPLYETAEAMLDAHPEIDLLVELAGKQGRVRTLRRDLPESVSLVDHVAAVFFCGLHNMLQASMHCRRNLDHSRALLRAVMDEVKEDILLLDKEQRVVDMNRHVRERLGDELLLEDGALRKGTTLGTPCTLLDALEDGDCFCQTDQGSQCPYDITLSTGEKAESLMTRVNKQGRLIYYRVYSYPVRDSDGVLTHVLLMRRNITARTMHERRQQHSEKMAMLGELSSYLAHEIRNPLFSIAGFTRSLQRSHNLNDEDREKLEIITQETRRLDQMLKSMLAFSRVSEMDGSECDLNRVAEQTVQVLRIGRLRHGYRIELEKGGNLPNIKGRAEDVQQCLVNLVNNSFEAMPDGGVVTVRTALEQERVLLQVQDSGTGMPPENMEKVFSPFYSTKPQGYGMGLAMIKKTVEEFGGSVELSSSQGRGTTVSLYFLPVLADAPTGSPTTQDIAALAEKPGPEGNQ